MIKFAQINITYRKSNFSRVIYFNDGDDIKDSIVYEVDDLICDMSKLCIIPKYFIKKYLYTKRYSIRVDIYSIYNVYSLSEHAGEKKLEEFKSEPFCDNEDLASFIMESYSNKGFSKRILGFGNLDNYWSFRRELSDYDLRDKFYKIGDIVMVDNYKDPFIITWCWGDEYLNNYDFSNVYDVFCIKDNRIQFTCDDGVHYNNITKVVGHNLDLAKRTIMANKLEYTEEHIEEVMAMKE